MGQEILKTKGITKSFFGNEVLKGVDLDVLSGEVHGLVGENGAEMCIRDSLWPENQEQVQVLY